MDQPGSRMTGAGDSVQRRTATRTSVWHWLLVLQGVALMSAPKLTNFARIAGLLLGAAGVALMIRAWRAENAARRHGQSKSTPK